MTQDTRYDLHIHTTYLKCANETMTVPALLEECARLNLTCLGIADHLNTVDRLPLHKLIRRDLEQCETELEVYFGVELNFRECDGDFAFSEEIRDELGCQYAIGGIHSIYCEECDLSKIVDIQHRHHLLTCRNPLVDVLVHPYWFSTGEFSSRGWTMPESVKCVPEAYARELGQVARETRTAIEINAAANLLNPAYPPGYVDAYADFLAAVAAEGPMFTVGSDAHDISHLAGIQAAWDFLGRLGLAADRVWRPACAPFNA